MKNEHRIRVAVLGDVRLYREGISSSLAEREGFELMGAASTQSEALGLCRRLDVDILVLDMAMVGSLDVLSKIAAELPAVRVVAFAVDEIEDDVLACAEAGVSAYVPRDASLNDLVAIIESASRTELICSPRIAAKLLGRAGARRDSIRETAGATVTRREREVWQLIKRGHANKEIAGELGISASTVKNHVHNLLEKLNVSSRAEAAAAHYTAATLPSRTFPTPRHHDAVVDRSP